MGQGSWSSGVGLSVGVRPDTLKCIDEDHASSRSCAARRAVDLGVGLVLILALALPMLLTNRAYFGDWGNHLFLLDQQTRWLESHLAPTYFVHTAETGAFYPHFMFYGGTLYWLVGRLATVVGPVLAYKLTSFAAMTTCYFGAVWLARLVRVTGLAAHLPAIAVVTGSYYLSKQYLDGGWPEFVALSMMPMVVGSAAALLTGRSTGIGAALALVVSLVLLTGSHGITAEYGLIFLFSLAAVMAVVFRDWIKVSRKRVLLVLMLAVVSIGINSWFLVPAVVYAHLTVIGQSSLFDRFDSLTADFNDWRVVFHVGRVDPRLGTAGAPEFYVQEPTLVIIWLVVIGGLVRRKAELIARRLFWGLGILFVGYLTLIMWRAPWRLAPDFLQVIQFRFRLHPYVGYCIAGLMIAALFIVHRAARPLAKQWLTLGLAIGTTVNFGAGVWQVWSAPRFLKISEILSSEDSLPMINYTNCPAPCPWVNTDYRMVERLDDPNAVPAKPVDLTEARNGTVSLVLPGNERTLVNVAWSPLITVKAGRATTGSGPEGLLLVDTRSDAPGAPTRIQLGTKSTVATRVGAGISLGALVMIPLALFRTRQHGLIRDL
jgi:hypothetical protein